MPRDLYLRLNIPIPNHKGYRFSHSTGTLLKSAGWNIVKETRKFSYLKPPYELAPGKTTDIKTIAPTDDEIIAIAQAFHDSGEAARKMVQAFPAYYRPASATSYSSHKVSPTTGEKSAPSEGSAVQSLHIPATLRIGLWGIWEVEVYWDTDSQPILVKHPHQEIPPPEPTLFDVIEAPEPLKPQEISPEVRYACIAHHGLSCHACGFDFAAQYGALGEGFILIHPLTQPPQSPATHPIDPMSDLRPICANCQAILHRTAPALTLTDLKSSLLAQRAVSLNP